MIIVEAGWEPESAGVMISTMVEKLLCFIPHHISSKEEGLPLSRAESLCSDTMLGGKVLAKAVEYSYSGSAV